METGKPGLASAPVYISSIAEQTEKRMDIQSPLTAVYIQAVRAPTSQPSCQRPAAAPEPAALHLPMPPLYSKETLPLLTLHIVGGLQSQPGLSLAAAAPAARPKSAGKHVCPHCGRDCMKPSVLEKHLRCHTGERPYPCTTCGVSFKTQSNLYKHKRTQAHARLSYESEQSSLGSLDSSSSSRDLQTSSLSLEERGKEAGSLEGDGSLAEAGCPAIPKDSSKEELAGERVEPPAAGHDTKTREATETTKEERQVMDRDKPPLSHGRHLPLQRQEATLFSKQWESSVCRGKSQGHESTDSGFSESSDHYPSPGSLIHDHSMDSLAESTKEHPEEATGTQAPSEPGHGGPPMPLKDSTRVKEQKSLEERISKLISENTAVMEDKHLENVRPRKTVLSKQGSIDLPMPYTYKDSFHFDMRISKTPNVGSQRNKNPGFYSSVPTQHSSSTEHAPLTRSHSLPFSVTLMQPERSSPSSAHHSDYATLARRGSAGQINQTSSAMKPVNQHSSAHRPLVRQTAVDCNHATDALFANSSVEEACASSLSCDGDGGDICGEPSNRKFRRKKTQKFAYNKWYMYGGGTFKKLYNADKGGDSSGVKGRKSTNPENEVVQGLQKRLSTVYKEPVSTTCSAMNFTSRCATVCHPGCPPAKLCAVDFNRNRGQLLSSCSSAITPLQRNLSLPVLPSPSAGSLVTQTTERMIRVESERLSDEGTHADSTSQLYGSLAPSDRKKQRTDDKIICPVEMETDANTPTPLPLSANSRVPQPDTNLAFVNLQTNHAQPKESLFPPTLINANSQPVSGSPGTSIPFIAKNNFLPKYQLKLPNAAELDSSPTPSADKSAGTESSSIAPPSSITEQTPSLALTAHRDPVSSPSTNLLERVPLLRTTATLCQAANATPNLAVVQSSLAETTITTTCLHDHQTRLCSALAHNNPSTVSAVSSAVELHQPPAPTRTTKDYQTPAFSQGQPPTHTQETPEPSNLGDQFGSFGSTPPVVPCHIVPFDSVQPAGQNVFHVHTADLQICLQIISDEQLALIEPQIERQASGSRSQKQDMENVVSEGIQSTSPKLNPTNKEAGGPQLPAHQRDLEHSEFLQRTESIKSPLSVYFEMPQPNLHMSECINSTPATVSAESEPPEARASQLQPQKHGHVNTAAETPGGVGDTISIAASFKGVNSRWSRAAEGEHALSVNHSAERQNLPDGRPSQGGQLSKVLPSQHKLTLTSPSPGTVYHFSARSELPVEESQNKHKNQGGSCKESTITSMDEASPGASAETRPSTQVGDDQGCVDSCADKPSWTTFSTGKCKIPRQVNPQTPTHCGNPVESTSSGTLDSSKQAQMEHSRVEPSDNSQNEISSVGQQHFTSGTSDIQVERSTEAKDPTAGRRGGASPLGRAAPDQLQAQGRGGTPGQPDGSGCRPRSGPGTPAGDSDHNEGASSVRGEAAAGRRGAAQSDSKHMLPPNTTKTQQGGDGELRQDSRLSEEHLSQTHSGMCASPPRCPQPDPDPPDHRRVTAPSASPWPHAGHFDSSGQQQCEGQQSKVSDQPRPPSKASAQLAETFPQFDAGRQQTPARQAQTGLPGNGGVAACRCDTATSGSHKITFAEITAGFQGDGEEAMWLETDAGGRAARGRASPSAEEVAGSKCEAIFLAAQLHGEQSGECLSGAVMPVLHCQGDAEDASSSDDEGKLIIEL